MRPGIPWSVKGIEPEAREAAKIAARRAGMTLGAWLNQAILDHGTDEMSASGQSDSSWAGSSWESASTTPRIEKAPLSAEMPPLEDASVSESYKTLLGRTEGGMADVLKSLASRLEDSETRAERAFRDVDSAVARIAERLERSQRRMDEVDGHASETLKTLQGTMGEVAERLNRVEQGSVRGDTVRDLEKAVGGVVDHIEQADARTGRAIRHIEHAIEDLVGRLERLSVAGDEATRDALKSVERSLGTLGARLDDVERKAGDAGQSAAQAQKAAAEIVATEVVTIKNQLGDVTERVQRTEEQTLRALHGLSAQIERFAKAEKEAEAKIEELPPPPVAAALKALSTQLADIDERNKTAIEDLRARVEKLAHQAADLTAPAPQPAPSPMHSLFFSGASLPMPPPAPAASVPHIGSPPPFAQAPMAPMQNTFVAPPPMPPPPPPPPPPPVPLAASTTGFQFNQPVTPPVQNTSQAPAPSDDYIAAARRAALAASSGQISGGYRADRRTQSASPRRGLNIALGVLTLAALGAGAYAWFTSQPSETAPRERLSTSLEGPAPADSKAGTEDETAAGGPSYVPEENAASDTAIADFAGTEGENVISSDESDYPQEPAASGDLSATEIANGSATRVAALNPGSAVKVSKAPVAKSAPQTLPRPAPGSELPGLSGRPTGPVEEGPLDSAVTGKTPTKITPSARAADPLRQAALGGNAMAQYQLGINYLEGNGVSSDAGQAVAWLKKAASQNFAAAQYRLGTLYEKGEGVTAKPEEARRLYESAAKSGNRKAMHNLAVMHAEGAGTKQDFVAAAKWFGEAARLGLTDSQYNLAILYERGLGVQSDLAEAYKWYVVAASAGDKDAGPRHSALESRLDADVLMKARLAAENFRPSPIDPLANGAVRFNAAAAAAPAKTGAVSSDITRVQTILRDLGYDIGTPDGRMGDRTKRAIMDFEPDRGREPTGRVTPNLLRELEAALS